MPGSNHSCESIKVPRPSGSAEPLLSLLKERLSGPIEKLFVELTRLRLHVVWHDGFCRKPKVDIVSCPAARVQCVQSGRLPGRCRECLKKNWNTTASARQGRRFVGACGLTNFRLGLHVGNASPLVTLGLQAQINDKDAIRDPDILAEAFEQAVVLLQLIHQDLAMTVRATTAEAAADRLQRRLTTVVLEQTRSSPQRLRPRPELPDVILDRSAGRRARQLVQAMVAYVHEHYHRPMSLGVVAAALKMNAAYLCDIFSQTQGMTFHQYLVEFRMTKAKEMLRDPQRSVSEVASAVGYASADQFRHSFKAHVGVPPSVWR